VTQRTPKKIAEGTKEELVFAEEKGKRKKARRFMRSNKTYFSIFREVERHNLLWRACCDRNPRKPPKDSQNRL
jgi:hypothetical protein